MGVTRVLGIDAGDKRIGIALSDPEEILASPLTIINTTDEESDIAAILDIIREYEIGKIIAGIPMSLNGSIGPQAEKVRSFIEKLRSRTEVPIEYRDERLTTVSAMRFARGVAQQRRGKKERYDDRAAALILQGYLDEHREL